jgi:hypothetical protein
MVQVGVSYKVTKSQSETTTTTLDFIQAFDDKIT